MSRFPRPVTVRDRRRMLIRSHQLAGDAVGPEAVAQALVALHATDPASVYLSVLARSAGSTVADIAAAMYERRTLVRWMAMRRTLFVFARADIPMIQAAVGQELAKTLRRRLISQLRRNGTEPALPEHPERWLAELEQQVERALVARGAATGPELAADAPGLKTRIRARTSSERPQNLTSPLLTVMSADGWLVRGTATGTWTTRQHRWEPVEKWWPNGIPALDVEGARRDLARRWLERFGPARAEDLQWWTGWNQTITQRALRQSVIEEVDLHGAPGIDLTRRESIRDDAEDITPVATLLPSLDPTPMGWKDRRWFLGVDPSLVFDRAGNIGPTVWWDGEIVGCWAVEASGEIRWRIVTDRGSEARAAIGAAATRLHRQLEGAIITPAARTPLERSLSTRVEHDGRR